MLSPNSGKGLRMIVVYFGVWILVKLYIQDFLVVIANGILDVFWTIELGMIASGAHFVFKVALNEFVLAFLITLPIAIFLKRRGVVL